LQVLFENLFRERVQNGQCLQTFFVRNCCIVCQNLLSSVEESFYVDFFFFQFLFLVFGFWFFWFESGNFLRFGLTFAGLVEEIFFVACKSASCP